jgi:hypothetical protein
MSLQVFFVAAGTIGCSQYSAAPPRHTGRAPVPGFNLIITKDSYEVRSAEPLDKTYARGKTRELLTALKHLEARADGRTRISTSRNEIDSVQWAGSFAAVGATALMRFGRPPVLRPHEHRKQSTDENPSMARGNLDGHR